MKRVNYIDNLRWITVSLLILFHTSMAYNTWGEENYIFLGPKRPPAALVTFIAPWFMPLMFLLAGVSAGFSLRKRGYGTFIKERLVRLGIPLIIGILVICPVLSFIADVTHKGYKGNIFTHYGVFFTRFTDLTGYDGGFTLAHLWFIAVLIVISIITLPIIKLFDGDATGDAAEMSDGRKKHWVVIAVLSIISIAAFEVKFAGKPLIMYLGVYLLGYFLFSDEDFVSRLSEFRGIFAAIFVIASLANVFLFIYIGRYELLNNICNFSSFVFGLPALVGLGHDYLDFSTGFTRKCAKLSYDFYIIHFPVVVLLQYMFLKLGVGLIPNFLMTIFIAYPVTFILCFVIEKLKVIRRAS